MGRTVATDVLLAAFADGGFVTAPPTDSVVSLLGWGVSAVLIGSGFLWRLREKERTERLAKAEAKIDILEAARDELQAKYSSEIKRTAASIGMARRALEVQAGREPSRAVDLQETTGVHDLLNDDLRRDVDRLARDFLESSPPPGALPPMRPKQRSRGDT